MRESVAESVVGEIGSHLPSTTCRRHHAASASTMTALHARAWRAMGCSWCQKGKKGGCFPSTERAKKKSEKSKVKRER